MSVKGILKKGVRRLKKRMGSFSQTFLRIVQKLPFRRGDEKFLARISSSIEKMPVSTKGRYYRPFPYRIGIICDQFYYDSVYAAANFVYVSPRDWQESTKDIDLLLFVTAWKGLHNEEWRFLAHEDQPIRQTLLAIIDDCKKREIPTVFYSKEDPPHYDHFLYVAKRCDYVFTTAEEVAADYRRDCGHDRVGVLSFGINPGFQNPVGLRHKKAGKSVIFSGTWMAKYKERCQELDMIFNGILDAGFHLKIVDRMYEMRNDPRYQYPKRYRKMSSPAIEHDLLQKVHKLYDWAVNINSVKQSRTMFANRAYELQASGNLLLSNFSVGVNRLLPTVFLVHEKNEVGAILNGFSPEEVYERQMAGVRFVMTGQTCYDRIGCLLRTVGFNAEVTCRKVLVAADRLTDALRADFEKQSYPEKTLISESELTDELASGYDLIAFFRAGEAYGVFYLEDMINAFKYTDCDYVTKNAYPGHEAEEHCFTSTIGSRYRSVFWRESYSVAALLALQESAELPNGYAADRFGIGQHNKEMPTAPRLTAVIPVGKGDGVVCDGWRLYGKAFASLRRSSLFESTEILVPVADDTDARSLLVLRDLTERYPNLKLLPCGGEDAVAVAAKAASADCLLLLRPCDELVNDGAAALLSAMTDGDFEIVAGNVRTPADERSEVPMLYTKDYLLRCGPHASHTERIGKTETVCAVEYSSVLR